MSVHGMDIARERERGRERGPADDCRDTVGRQGGRGAGGTPIEFIL